MVKFLHAADLHIDSPLRGLDLYEGAPVDAIRGATRRAFSNLVQLAIDEKVDFVILAGDIYDGDWPDYNTGLFFVKEVRRLGNASIPVVLIRGNHDAASRITSRLSHPANVHVLPVNQAGTIKFDSLRVALHGQSFASQAETRNIAIDYSSPISDWFNIGVLHTSLDGREGHDTYAPCSVEQLVAHGYDYWALGHVHKRESVNGAGRVRIEFPGNIQGRHIRETGPKGCLLVTIDDGLQSSPVFRALDVFRWEELAIRVPARGSLVEAEDCAAEAIDDARQQTGGLPLAVRLNLICEVGEFELLAKDSDHLRHELAARAGEHVWIEKIKLSQAAPPVEGVVGLAGDSASELHATLAELRSNPEAVQRLFAEGDCDHLRKKLPVDFRKILDGQNPEEIFDLATAFLGGGLAEGDA